MIIFTDTSSNISKHLDSTAAANDNNEIHFRIYESTSGTDGPSIADVSRSQANLISPSSSHGAAGDGVDWSDVDLSEPAMMDVGGALPPSLPVAGVVGGADGKQQIPYDEEHPCK